MTFYFVGCSRLKEDILGYISLFIENYIEEQKPRMSTSTQITFARLLGIVFGNMQIDGPTSRIWIHDPKRYCFFGNDHELCQVTTWLCSMQYVICVALPNYSTFPSVLPANGDAGALSCICAYAPNVTMYVNPKFGGCLWTLAHILQKAHKISPTDAVNAIPIFSPTFEITSKFFTIPVFNGDFIPPPLSFYCNGLDAMSCYRSTTLSHKDLPPPHQSDKNTTNSSALLEQKSRNVENDTSTSTKADQNAIADLFLAADALMHLQKNKQTPNIASQSSVAGTYQKCGHEKPSGLPVLPSINQISVFRG